MNDRDVEQLAIALRQAAFPGALGWAYANQDTRARWVKAAELANGRIERAKDQVLREATAKAHELGQHAAAKMLRELRFAAEVEQIAGSEGIPDALINTRDRGCADPVPGAIAPGDDPGVGGTVKVVPRVPS
jgi:hypothetical protein